MYKHILGLFLVVLSFFTLTAIADDGNKVEAQKRVVDREIAEDAGVLGNLRDSSRTELNGEDDRIELNPAGGRTLLNADDGRVELNADQTDGRVLLNGGIFLPFGLAFVDEATWLSHFGEDFLVYTVVEEATPTPQRKPELRAPELVIKKGSVSFEGDEACFTKATFGIRRATGTMHLTMSGKVTVTFTGWGDHPDDGTFYSYYTAPIAVLDVESLSIQAPINFTLTELTIESASEEPICLESVVGLPFKPRF